MDEPTNSPLDTDHDHDLLLRAAGRIPAEDTDAVLSHDSAARRWNLPRSRDAARRTPAPDRVEYTCRDGRPRQRVALRRRVASLADADVEHWCGVRVTSLPRTVMDLVRSSSDADTIVLFDHLLHSATYRRDELHEMLRTATDRRRMRAGAEALAVADGRCCTPDETRNRLLVRHLGFPAPEVNVMILTDDGSFPAMFWWPELGVVGEFDAAHQDDGPLFVPTRREQYGSVSFDDVPRRAPLFEDAWSECPISDAHPFDGPDDADGRRGGDDAEATFDQRRRALLRAGITTVRWGPDDERWPFALEVRLRSAGLPLRGQPSPAVMVHRSGDFWLWEELWRRPDRRVPPTHPGEPAILDLRTDGAFGGPGDPYVASDMASTVTSDMASSGASTTTGVVASTETSTETTQDRLPSDAGCDHSDRILRSDEPARGVRSAP